MHSKNKAIEFSIVIPALNEAERIGKSLDELTIFLKTNEAMRGVEYEVLIVSADGSDNTADVAASHGKDLKNFRVLRPGPRLGKGRDVQFGMLSARGKYVLFMDADLATPLHHIPPFLKLAQEGEDVVIATRNLLKHHTNLPRRMLSNAGNLAFRILGGVWVEDSQCGFKMFSKRATKTCFSRQTIMNWGFDMELLTIAKINNFSIKTVRINDWHAVAGGPFDSSHTLKNAVNTLKDLLIIAKKRLFGTYR